MQFSVDGSETRGCPGCENKLIAFEFHLNFMREVPAPQGVGIIQRSGEAQLYYYSVNKGSHFATFDQFC